VRQYVHAPVHRFAAVVPPEFSTLCLEEMRSLGFSETEITEAGVEFSGKLAVCYEANLWLRTAGRVLCRLPSFRAGAIEELFQKVSGLGWELWLNPTVPLCVDTHVEHSRIEHEGKVADTVVDGIEKRFKEAGLPVPSRWKPGSEELESVPPSFSWNQRILVYLRENRCEISLDTTGPHLHQRGYRLEHTGAPIRETLVSAILKKSSWKGNTPLVDGMCGSGTVPIEAALMARRMPPGRGRPFLFEKWPSFQDKTWEYLSRKAAETALVASPVPIVAVDNSTEAIDVARRNGERAGVDRDVRWECKDFFDFRPRDYGLSPGLLVINPPYGKRLKEDVGLLYQRLGAHMSDHFKGWRAAILAPSRSLAMSLRMSLPRSWHIVHGGIPIIVVMGRV
jgi:putative N6-adenine-specific DNA methylase